MINDTIIEFLGISLKQLIKLSGLALIFNHPNCLNEHHFSLLYETIA